MTFFVENAWPNTKTENNVTGILTVKKDSPKSVTTASCIAAMPGKCDEDNRPTISILVVEKYGCTALLPLYSPSLSDLFHFPLILTKKWFWIWDVDLFPLAFVVFLPAEGDIVPLKLLALSLSCTLGFLSVCFSLCFSLTLMTKCLWAGTVGQRFVQDTVLRITVRLYLPSEACFLQIEGDSRLKISQTALETQCCHSIFFRCIASAFEVCLATSWYNF